MYNLQKDIRDNNLPIDTLLIEASGKLGGKIQTVQKMDLQLSADRILS